VDRSFDSSDLAVDVVLDKAGIAYCVEVNFFQGRRIPDAFYAYEVTRNIAMLNSSR
jgi:hypothetical protein